MPAESRIVPSVKGDLNVAYDTTYESAQVAWQLEKFDRVRQRDKSEFDKPKLGRRQVQNAASKMEPYADKARRMIMLCIGCGRPAWAIHQLLVHEPVEASCWRKMSPEQCLNLQDAELLLVLCSLPGAQHQSLSVCMS